MAVGRVEDELNEDEEVPSFAKPNPNWNERQQKIFWAQKQQKRRRERKARNDAEETPEE